MPNHVHFILIISDENIRVDEEMRATARVAPTVGLIVGGFKSLVSNSWLKKCKENGTFMGQIWQRNYYEHIIRDEEDYQIKWNYIDENPEKWETDEYNNYIN